jgi:hypothetical protein
LLTRESTISANASGTGKNSSSCTAARINVFRSASQKSGLSYRLMKFCSPFHSLCMMPRYGWKSWNATTFPSTGR